MGILEIGMMEIIHIDFISYFSTDFLLYLCRWIISAFVMMAPLYLINKFRITDKISEKYKEYVDLILIQIAGAFIFWYIDQMIFNK